MSTTPPASVSERLMQMAARRSGLDTQAIDPQAPFSELGIDSLSLAELLFDIDDAFGVDVDNNKLANLRCVNDLVALIEREIAARDPASPALAAGAPAP